MAEFQFDTPLRQSWPLPSVPRPIVVIGAGGIVHDAHLPTYRKLGFEVAGLFDLDQDKARRLSEEFELRRVFPSLQVAAAQKNVVFDVAVPATAVLDVLSELPAGAPVLIQKPMGPDLDSAKKILAVCERKQLVAAINFQLRFSPNVLALKDALDRRLFGQLADVEVRVNTHMPWHLWEFMKGIPRHEILYHSIHYVDTLRHLLGEPQHAYARVTRHPSLSHEYSDTSSALVLDYGDWLRICLSMNHAHRCGPKHAMSAIKLEGTSAVAVAQMGVNLNYPEGEPDTLELCRQGGSHWESVALRGSWFTEAFEGPMSNLQRFVAGEDEYLVSGVKDAIKTMAVVEACYRSSQSGGTPIPDV